MCVDPVQARSFFMFYALAKGFTMGAPMFFSPKAFINTMKGKGVLGPILTSLGIQPVQFLSEAEMLKMISTESKIFSIYADGVVPGFRRETRVRIHAVVDFRSAPAPGYGPGFSTKEGTSESQGGTSGTESFGRTSATGEQAGQNALRGALVPSTGGTVLYWRME